MKACLLIAAVFVLVVLLVPQGDAWFFRRSRRTTRTTTPRPTIAPSVQWPPSLPNGDVTIDLNSGIVSGSHSQISITKQPTRSTHSKASTNPCNLMGQVRINFAAGQKKGVKIEYKMGDLAGHVYHIAKGSSINGYGGTQGSEIHGTNDEVTFYVNTDAGYLSEVVRPQVSANLRHIRMMKFNQYGYARFIVKDQYVEWSDNKQTEGIDVSRYLFKNIDTAGDRSLWVSFNRVNADYPSNRRGVGVCGVRFTMV